MGDMFRPDLDHLQSLVINTDPKKTLKMQCGIPIPYITCVIKSELMHIFTVLLP